MENLGTRVIVTITKELDSSWIDPEERKELDEEGLLARVAMELVEEDIEAFLDEADWSVDLIPVEESKSGRSS